ncbi:hypothetical protein ECDEC3C_1989 [Escherichia coli DEC3C]|nr:hypothetical protein ECDEC3C_1989 [Escherichia coli DEC3C]EIO29703.1 hypothetical protein ECPA40_1922 [Escherichia coli PA40]
MNYIKHLIRHTNDPIFEEQFYKITQSHIDFDKRAKDEKMTPLTFMITFSIHLMMILILKLEVC